MYSTSADWKSKIYQESTEHLLEVYINGTKINSDYILGCKISHKLFSDDIVSLGSVSMRKLELQVYKDAIVSDISTIEVKYGILIDTEYEIIPMGIFYLSQPVEKSDDTISVVANDSMSKFEFNYDASEIVPATLLEVLQDICTKSGVELGSTSFLNSDSEINVYDNTITARTYLSYISELAGGFAYIGRDNKLYIREIFKDESEMDIELLSDYSFYSEYEISRVTFQDGIRAFTFGDETQNTLWINPDNPYVVSDTQIENIYDELLGINATGIETSTIIDPALDLGDKLIIDGKNIIYQYEIEYIGKFKALISSKIQSKEKEDTTTINGDAKVRKFKASIDQIEGSISLIASEQDSQSTQLTQITQTIDNITTQVEQDIPDLVTKYNTIIQDIDQLNISIGMKNGTNLIRNSAMKSGYDYWLKEPWLSYVESDEPPVNPYSDMWWYCTENLNGYERGIFYRWNDTIWEKTTATKATFGDDNLLENVEYSENEYARQNTISGSTIIFNGKTDYSVSHIFCVTAPVDIVATQDYLVISHLLKNNINTGVIYMGVAFLPMYIEDLRNIDENEVASIYEAGVLLTPDDFTDLTKIERVIKIPKKEDVINVVTSATALVDTTKIWLDTTINLPKQYIDSTWTILEDRNSLLDQDGFIWTYRAFFYGYYQTSYTIDDFVPKIAYCFFTLYPAFTLAVQGTEPTPYKGLYWADNSESGTVKRAKYNSNNEFVEWIETGFPTAIILANPLPSPPYPLEYAMPLNGNYLIADLKMEYGKISSPWTSHPEEMYGKNFKFDNRGFTIRSAQNEMFIDEDEINAMFNGTSIFSIFKEQATFARTKANTANIADIEIQHQEIDGDSVAIEF